MSPSRLPAEIYWRRRLLLLAVLIAVVWAVLRFMPGGSDDAEPTATEATPTPTQTVPTPTPTPTPTEPQVNGVVPVTLTADAKQCDPETIRVTPSVRPGQLAGGPVDVGLLVSSTSQDACTLTAAGADLLVVISANKVAVYDSTVCKSSLLTTPVTVSPGWGTLATAQWTGRGSGAVCDGTEGFATPGEYVLQAGTLGGEPGRTTFTLDQPPAPAATTQPPTTPPAA